MPDFLKNGFSNRHLDSCHFILLHHQMELLDSSLQGWVDYWLSKDKDLYFFANHLEYNLYIYFITKAKFPHYTGSMAAASKPHLPDYAWMVNLSVLFPTSKLLKCLTSNIPNNLCTK